MDRYQKFLHQIESESEDELSYFNELEPRHFSTLELYRLLGQWEIKQRLFRQCQRFILRTISFSPVWLLATFVFGYLGWGRLALVSLTLFPLSFVVFFGGLYYINTTFHGKGHLEGVGEKIRGELRRRQEEKTQSN